MAGVDVKTELVHTTTSDGMRLDGALHTAEEAARNSFLAADVLVCLHGVASNFYSSKLLAAIVPDLLDAGIAMLCGNTRGHDMVYTTMLPSGPRRQGAAYEIVDECRLDVAAWVQYLQLRGFSRIGVMGHSLGAIKAVYSQAHQPQETACLIAISPPRLSYAVFSHGLHSGQFLESYALARNCVREQREAELIDVSFPFPTLMTAAGYLDKYGPEERYNILRFVDRVRTPMLFVYGAAELETGNAAFAGMPDALKQKLGEDQPPAEILTIPNADHSYSGAHADLSSAIRRWLS